MAKNKKPRVGADPPKKKKRPVPGAPIDGEDPCLVFGLQLIDSGGRWPWSDVSASHMKAITDKCKAWEKMKQSELFGPGGNKRIPMENLIPDAQTRLRDLELDDYEIWELRVTGKQRIWGVRSGHVFYPVWWDPKHQVCPSTKKNN